MELRVIRDELQHAALLEQAKELALSDPLPGTNDAARLEVISVLLEKYEEARFKFEAPDPIEAIVLRLAELGLKQKDLGEILGSKSRASEVLARKRALTIEMIRSLHEHLKIPAEILIGQPAQTKDEKSEIDWKQFPIREMQKRGWFDAELSEGKTGEQLIRSFFSRGSVHGIPVLLRKTLTNEIKTETQYAIFAWAARVLIVARDLKRPDVRYVQGSITDEFLRQIAKLSFSVQGPLLAREFLAMKGIPLVIVPHLPKTKLDGAAMLDQDGTPVVGLTLRYDRPDYFWFTLMHELIHVQRHLGRQNSAFIDEDGAVEDDERETEANILAAEAFIPRQIWKSSEAYRTKRSDAVLKLANSLQIHPSIVAGRIQRETGKYTILKEFAANCSILSVFKLSPSGESHE